MPGPVPGICVSPARAYTSTMYSDMTSHSLPFSEACERNKVTLACVFQMRFNEDIRRIRSAIADDPGKWRSVAEDGRFSKRHKLVGDSLKRPPRGFDPEHTAIEELKRKDFISIENFSQTTACSAGFIDMVAESFEIASPLVRFLTEAVGQRF